MNREPLTLKQARDENRLAEFIEQHSDELADDAEFIQLLEKMEKAQQSQQSSGKTSS